MGPTTAAVPSSPLPLAGEGGEQSEPGEGLSMRYFVLGKLNSAPALIPAGQRVVTVLTRV